MHTLETKSASASDTDVNAAYGEFMRAFESFKETNDDRLAQLERRSSADPVTSDKLSPASTVRSMKPSASSTTSR